MISFAILTFLGFLGILFCIYMLGRNQSVYDYRSSLLDEIKPGEKYFHLKIDWFNSVQYEEMNRKFWVWPLSKFYKETCEEYIERKKKV